MWFSFEGIKMGNLSRKLLVLATKIILLPATSIKIRRKYSVNKIYDNGNNNLHADSKIIIKENMWIKREGKKGA